MKRRLFFVNPYKEAFKKQLLKSKPDGINDISNFKGIKIYFDNDNLRCFIQNTSISEYDVVYYKFWRKEDEIIIALNEIAKKITPETKQLNWNLALAGTIGSKLVQVAKLFGIVRIPKTIYFSKDLLKPPIYKELLDELGKEFVAKATKSSLGKDLYKISNIEDFDYFLKHKRSNKLYIFQELIEHNEMYRVDVIDGRAVTLQKTYKNKDNFIINVSKGCVNEFIDLANLSKENKDKCEEIARKFGYLVAGIDMTILKTGEMCVFEINSNPGINNKENNPEFLAYYGWVNSL